jgi:hypothetical protein
MTSLHRDDRERSSARLGTPALTGIDLPAPTPGHSMSVFAALERRRTTREISDRALSLPLLSGLLSSSTMQSITGSR